MHCLSDALSLLTLLHATYDEAEGYWQVLDNVCIKAVGQVQVGVLKHTRMVGM
jgi:hypothetical protein